MDLQDVIVLNVKADNYVMSYVNGYIDAKYFGADSSAGAKMMQERVRAYLGYGNKEPRTAGSKLLSKMNESYDINYFYKVIFALRMEMAEAVAFLNFYGKSFPSSFIDEKVETIKSLITNNIYDLYEVNDELVKNGHQKLFIA